MLPVGVGSDISVLLDCCFACVKFFGHPNYSRDNTKIFLEIIGSK
jgi:hypothetical protein